MIKAIKFMAGWCGPCKVYAPQFAQAVADAGIESEEYDVDEYPNVASAFGITTVPTTLLVCGEDIQEKIVGVVKADELVKFVEKVGEACSR